MNALDLIQKIVRILGDGHSNENVVVEVGNFDHAIKDVYVDGKGDICVVVGSRTGR